MGALQIGEQPDAKVASLSIPAVRQADSLLLIYADALDDIERVRIANENRVRSLRQVKNQADTPEEARLLDIVANLVRTEQSCALELKRGLRIHPLGPFMRSLRGVGEKQGARLLATIGDPYWHARDDRPRRVSELWAYCGLHVLHPDSQSPADSHGCCAVGVDPSGTTDQNDHDPHIGCVGGAVSLGSPDQTWRDDQKTPVQAAVLPDSADHLYTDDHASHVHGVAPSRRRGQKANWNGLAKSRAYLVAESCVKAGVRMLPDCEKQPPSSTTRKAISPYGETYLARRDKTADYTHARECIRCGPAGRPALASSPWSAAHQHADALRIVSKTILKDLWRASRDLHQSCFE